MRQAHDDAIVACNAQIAELQSTIANLQAQLDQLYQQRDYLLTEAQRGQSSLRAVLQHDDGFRAWRRKRDDRI